jgi:hypothetical protein
MIAAIVNTTTLGKTILYSLIAGIGIAVIFGAGISSGAALVEARRARRTAASIAYGTLTVACVLAGMGAIVVGLVVMIQK